MKRLLCLLALAVLGCDLRARVLFVGDSNMAFSAATYSGLFYGGFESGGPIPRWLPTFAAMPGSGFRDAYASGTIDGWASAVADAAASSAFDGSVLNLGGNDALVGARISGEPVFAIGADYPGRIDAVLAGMPKPVVIIDAPYLPSALYSQSALVQVNLALQAATHRCNSAYGANACLYLNVNNVLATVPAAERYVDSMHFSRRSQVAIGREILRVLDPLL